MSGVKGRSRRDTYLADPNKVSPKASLPGGMQRVPIAKRRTTGSDSSVNVSALEISGPRFNRPFGESEEYPGFTREPPVPVPLEPPDESESI